MVIKFKTKQDIYGNTYWLTLNTDSKEFHRDYNVKPSDIDPIQIGKRDMNKLEKQLIANGFTKRFK